MKSQEPTNDRSVSTTWEWKRVKIAQPPQAKEHAERSESSLRSLLPWPRRKPLHLSVVYRGGPECWWEIRSRGRVIRRPGVMALHDVLKEIHQGIR